VRLAAFAVTLCCAASAAWAQAPAAAEILARAVAVHGGREALAAWPDLESRGSAEALSGRGRRADIVLRERADGAYRREVTFEFRGTRRTSVEFYDGRVVKGRWGASWDDLPLDEAREAAAHRLPWLLTLSASDAKVEGEAAEADVPCWTISVPDGRARAILAFAKDDGRLVALDYPGTSAEGMGTKKEVRRKLVFRDPRKVGDLLLPFDVTSLEDGTPDSRARWVSIVRLKEFAPEWVKIPDPTRRFIPPEELAF
jgi:hypothetical protein